MEGYEMSNYTRIIKQAIRKKVQLTGTYENQIGSGKNKLSIEEDELVSQFVEEWELFLDDTVENLKSMIAPAAAKLVEICLQEVLDFQRDSYAYDLLSEWIEPEKNPFWIFEEKTKAPQLLNEQCQQLSSKAQDNYKIMRRVTSYRKIKSVYSHVDFILSNFKQTFYESLKLAIADETIQFSLIETVNNYAKQNHMYGKYFLYVAFFDK